MSEIRIEELEAKYNLDNNDILLVEDEEDTKKTKMSNVVNFLTANEDLDIRDQYNKFYNVLQIKKLLNMYSEGTNNPNTIAAINEVLSNIRHDVNLLEDAIKDKTASIDHCGLIENYGKYEFFVDKDIVEINPASPENSFKKEYYNSYEYKRNNKNSVKIDIATKKYTESPVFCIPIADEDNLKTLQDNDLISFMFYIDAATLDSLGTSEDGITLMLSGDNSAINPENYFAYTFGKNEAVNGWNCIKKKISEFERCGNPGLLRNAFIKMDCLSSTMDNFVIYVNSIIFGQRMKPTLLLNFDGVYKDTSFKYTYPYLKAKHIPATIFSNGSATLSDSNISSLLELRLLDHWDLGCNESTNNKEYLLEDTKFKEQYTVLRLTKEQWLNTKLVYNPISYSTSNNIRNITIPILKDLGYKIARDRKVNSYCSFFGEKDFCIPTVFFFNNTETTGTETEDIDIVTRQIDYIIETGQCMSLYTNNVTPYGSNVDANKAQFEAIINYIADKVKDGELQCLTFSEFYSRCVNE